MAYKLKPGNRQKISTVQKFTFAIGGASVIVMAVYFTFFFQTAPPNEMRAKNSLMANEGDGSGETIVEFNWDEGYTSIPVYGSEALEISSDAECVMDGINGTMGLGAGKSSKNIELTLANEPDFKTDGIDISVGFRRNEESGNFFTKGKDFNFGMKNGRLCIRYRLTSQNGKSTLIDETSDYELPSDEDFRTCRFIYNPMKGYAEMLVDGMLVWSKKSQVFDKLEWKTNDPAIIGLEMNGDGSGKCIFDNFIVRRINQTQNIPIELLGFTAEPEGKTIMISWFTGREMNTDYFIIEKSEDTKTFTQIGKIKAAGQSEEMKAYALLDKAPFEGVNYYRLALSNNRAKSVWVPVIAVRFKPQDMSLENKGTATSN